MRLPGDQAYSISVDASLMKDGSMPGMTSLDTEEQADRLAGMKLLPSDSVMPDVERCKTADARQLSNKSVKPSSDKVMLASALLTFWGLEFLWNSRNMSPFQAQTFKVQT